MTHVNPSSAQFFEAKYRENPDPWNFAGKPSEIFRYDAILAALAHQRYHHAFEPGCSIGVLTKRLAVLCDRVDAIDLSPTAVARARERCAHLSEVHITSASLTNFTDHIDPARLDLLVLSEIGYYQMSAAWAATSSALIQPMHKGATILAAHWLGHSADHRISGDEVHQILALNQLMKLKHAERHETFRLERWERT